MLKDVPPPRMQIMCLQIFIKKKKKKRSDRTPISHTTGRKYREGRDITDVVIPTV